MCERAYAQSSYGFDALLILPINKEQGNGEQHHYQDGALGELPRCTFQLPRRHHQKPKEYCQGTGETPRQQQRQRGNGDHCVRKSLEVSLETHWKTLRTAGLPADFAGFTSESYFRVSRISKSFGHNFPVTKSLSFDSS